MCCMHVVFLCFIFVLYEIVLAYVVFALYAGCLNLKKQKKKIMCCIFPRVERALIFCVIFFPRVERALVLLCCIFRAWNALWRYCVIFFRLWNALFWRYCVIFSARGTRSGVIVLYFPRVERALALLCYIFACGTRFGVIVLNFPRMESAMALLCYIFREWNALWYFVLNSFRVVIYLPCDLPVFISKLS